VNAGRDFSDNSILIISFATLLQIRANNVWCLGEWKTSSSVTKPASFNPSIGGTAGRYG